MPRITEHWKVDSRVVRSVCALETFFNSVGLPHFIILFSFTLVSHFAQAVPS